MKKRWSIRTYLWLLVLAVAAPCAGLLAYSIWSDAHTEEREARATTLNLAQLVASQTHEFLADAETVEKKLAVRKRGSFYFTQPEENGNGNGSAARL
jgi:hypothetical protein